MGGLRVVVKMPKKKKTPIRLPYTHVQCSENWSGVHLQAQTPTLLDMITKQKETKRSVKFLIINKIKIKLNVTKQLQTANLP